MSCCDSPPIKLTIYQNPLATEIVQITVPFDPPLAEVPTSAVVWLTRYGVTTEYPATLQPGATEAYSVVTFDPSGKIVDAGPEAYILCVRLRNAGLVHIGRSSPIAVNVLRYPSAP